MKKAPIIAIVIISILIISVVAYALNPQKPKNIEFTGDLFELLAQNQKIKCSYEKEADGKKIYGVMYVSGNKLLSESTTENDGNIAKDYNISDGEYFYLWQNNSSIGSKTKVEDFKKYYESITLLVSKEEQQQNIMDFKNESNFKCVPWDVDDSKFEIPSGIDFIENNFER